MLYEFILEDSENRMLMFNKWISKKIPSENYEIVHAEHVSEAKQLLFEHKWDIIFLDHDLNHKVFVDSSDYDTGFQVAKFIAENLNKIHFNKIIIHSQNPVGAGNMHSILRDAGVTQIYSIPFNSLIAHS